MSVLNRIFGRHFTVGNPFSNPAFLSWANNANIARKTILEPFAGANDLIGRLREMGICSKYASYDIRPARYDIHRRDTLEDFPRGYDVCITNPPWMAKNSATQRGIVFPDCAYDDIYKLALERCLEHCGWVAVLVPESFIRRPLFQDRLSDFVSLTGDMFKSTGHPVGLALFTPNKKSDVHVWANDESVGQLSALRKLRPIPTETGMCVSFNEPNGNVGLIALDNTREQSIRFCDVTELASYRVKQTGRHITKILVNGRIRIEEWNEYLNNFRSRTSDVLMTCYKGIRKDGKYRRRCDWALARGIIHHVGLDKI